MADIDRLVNTIELDEEYLEEFLSYIHFIGDMKFHIQKWNLSFFHTLDNLRTKTKRKDLRTVYPEGVDLTPQKYLDIRNFLIGAILLRTVQGVAIISLIGDGNSFREDFSDFPELEKERRKLLLLDTNTLFKMWQNI